jgi:hypothetical protein
MSADSASWLMMALSSMMKAANLASQERNVVRLLDANDPFLAPLILAETEDERGEALERVILDHARPLVDLVLMRHTDATFVGEEPEDIASTVVVRLVMRLRATATDESKAIASLADFTAALTFNAVYDAVRRRFPRRTRLKNRVRYVLLHDPRFRTERTACALARWPPAAGLQPPAPNVVDARFPQDRLGDAMAAILVASGGPVAVDDLVSELAEAWGIADAVAADPRAIDAVGAADDSLATRVESRQYLAALWREVAELRPQQRAALLLNLRDADQRNALALFVRVGIASIDAIASATGLTVEQLAAIWSELPLDDLRIAAHLGVTRQQVINLRKSARARLARRMGRL